MQTEVRGRDKLAFLESLTTADLINMPDNTATLAVFTDPLTGGILDDLIITKTSLGYYHLVSNASRRPQDQKLLEEAQVSAAVWQTDFFLRARTPVVEAVRPGRPIIHSSLHGRAVWKTHCTVIVPLSIVSR